MKTMFTDKELREKIIAAINLAVERLHQKAAKNDEELIIYQNGKVVNVKARKLLAEIEAAKIPSKRKKFHKSMIYETI
jgi:hypothetical protein